MSCDLINTSEAPAAIGPYSQGIRLGGLYFFSGQIGLNPQSGKLAEGLQSQIQQILNNLDALLNSQHLKRTDIVKTTVFLIDIKDFDAVNDAYKKYFTAPYPARSCVQISALPRNALVEIEAIAGQ